MVSDLRVDLVVHIGGEHITIQNQVIVDDLLHTRAEVRRHLFLAQVVEPVTVLVVDETVREHAARLMVPQTQQRRQALQ